MRLTRRGKIVLTILILILIAVPSAFIYSSINGRDSVTGFREQSPSAIDAELQADMSLEASTEVTPEISPQDISEAPVKAPAPTPDVIEEQPELVPYDGPIENIFFHPLIAYPELAFDNDDMAVGYDEWFVTVSEFNKILDSLYKKNFILVSMRDAYEQIDINGQKKLFRKQLMLPKNKKPIMISIDDMNYYTYMRKNGNVYKLIIDENKDIATYSVTPDGKELISKDNEIIPILDSFVQKHPDFSCNGAKGIISLTGYQGVLGYRTNDSSAPDYESVKEEAFKIVQKLKDTGWEFGCHSYGHRDTNKISYDRFTKDMERWKKEVGSIIGNTNIYLYPYGSRVAENSSKFKYLVASGFNVLMSVGDESYVKFSDSYVQMDRRHIDGLALKQQSTRLKDLLDSKQVLDAVRP